MFGAARPFALLILAGCLAVSAPVWAGAPDDLPGEAAGVVGSGSELSLRLNVEGGARILRPGDDYRDGWVLQSLTPSQATMIKGSEVRRVGLNPAGAAAQAGADSPATVVEVIGAGRPAAEILAELQQTGQWDGKVRPGLSLDETQRFLVQTYRVRQHTQDLMQTLPRGSVYTIGPDELRTLLGAAYDDYVALGAKTRAASPNGATPGSGAPPPGGNLTILRSYARPDGQ